MRVVSFDSGVRLMMETSGEVSAERNGAWVSANTANHQRCDTPSFLILCNLNETLLVFPTTTASAVTHWAAI